jgi:hypothetical protein
LSGWQGYGGCFEPLFVKSCQSVKGLLSKPFYPLAYCMAADIAFICSGVSLMSVPLVALNRVPMPPLLLAMAFVIIVALAPWKSPGSGLWQPEQYSKK